ncbi:hypothetical protein J1N35_012423 [Gossypium stocksii]|uniref:Uncharacterized protein n=1 Tax=Gossypium stocksii TaxID=47602 RepID=A0A9D3W6A6_9ROSI|nr:hypothetical protein J1N35_012423 [Gossypium stocksii]
MDLVDELQVLVSKLSELEINISDSLQVGAILSKLPPFWNGYRKKILHSPKSYTFWNGYRKKILHSPKSYTI